MKGHSPYEPDAPFEDSLHRTTHGKLPHSLAANHRVKPAFSPVKRLKPISPWKDPQVKYETAVREWKKELQSVSRDKLSPTTAKRLGRIHSRVLESYLGPTISQSAQKYKRRVGLKDQRLPKLQPFGKQPHSNREGNARRLSPVRYSKPTTPAHGGSRRRRGNQVVEVVAEQLEDDSIGNELGDLSLLSGRTSISSATAGILPSRLMSARTVMREKKNDIVRAIQKAFRAKKVRDELLAKALKGRKQSLLYKGGHKLCGRLILVQARILANGFHGHVAISGRKEVEVQFRDVSQGCMGILCTTLESLYNLTGLPQHHHGSIPRLNMDFLLKRLRLESQEVLVPEQFFDDLGIYYRKHQPLTLNRTTSFALQQSGRSSQQAVRLQRIYQRCQRVVVGLCKPPHQVLCHMDSTNLALDPIEWPPERGEPPKDIRLAPLPGLHVSPFMLSMTNVGSSMSQQTARGLRASRRLDVIEEEEEDFDDVVRPRSRASAKSRPKSPKSTKNNRAITIMEVNVLTLQELSKLQHSCPNFNTGMKMLGVAFQCKVTFLPPPMNSVVCLSILFTSDILVTALTIRR